MVGLSKCWQRAKALRRAPLKDDQETDHNHAPQSTQQQSSSEDGATDGQRQQVMVALQRPPLYCPNAAGAKSSECLEPSQALWDPRQFPNCVGDPWADIQCPCDVGAGDHEAQRSNCSSSNQVNKPANTARYDHREATTGRFDQTCSNQAERTLYGVLAPRHTFSIKCAPATFPRCSGKGVMLGSSSASSDRLG